MVGLLVGQREFATSDASDGLALAICHAHSTAGSRGRPAAPQGLHAGAKKKRLSLAEHVGITAEMVEGKKRT
jgi:hypothetical protein